MWIRGSKPPSNKNGFAIFSGAVAVGSKGGLGNQDGEPRAHPTVISPIIGPKKKQAFPVLSCSRADALKLINLLGGKVL